MAAFGYLICLGVSIAVVVWMAMKNYENIDIYYWTILLINPIILLSYWLMAITADPEASRILYCFLYLDSTILLTVMTFSMLRTMNITTKRWFKALLYGIAFAHMGVIWACRSNDLYYASFQVIHTPYGYATVTTDGPLKIVHYIYLIVVFAALIGIIAAGLFRKGTFSRRTLIIYAAVVGTGLLCYLYELVLGANFSLLPYLYAAAAVVIMHDYDHIHAHDMTSLISGHYNANSGRGYMALSLSFRFFSCNEKCREFLPFLATQRVDELLDRENEQVRTLIALIEDFEAGKASGGEFRSGDVVCRCDISYFSVRKKGKRQGYLLDIRDATEEKRTLDILTNYNETLNHEVAEKTENIRRIQRSVVLGMANMIENRDNNTGGHVKRTSDIIGILVDEIIRQGQIEISDQLAEDIVRAAPMHDLGKLHIDSSILCKPGKLTDEEYAIMKTHSTISGEMVMILLDNVEEPHFVETAYHVARYHHERWDGRGYPEGLVGCMIPLEARIMAVADVYDALVSRRCYKEPMSFDTASRIMCENMGTQFDPNMRRVFLGCRDQLEAYYTEANKAVETPAAAGTKG